MSSDARPGRGVSITGSLPGGVDGPVGTPAVGEIHGAGAKTGRHHPLRGKVANDESTCRHTTDRDPEHRALQVRQRLHNELHPLLVAALRALEVDGTRDAATHLRNALGVSRQLLAGTTQDHTGRIVREAASVVEAREPTCPTVTVTGPPLHQDLAPATRRFVRDVVLEAITNGVRHRDATAVTVVVDEDDVGHRIAILTTGPARTEPTAVSSGQGMKLLDDAARHVGATVEFVAGDDRSVVVATVPIDRRDCP